MLARKKQSLRIMMMGNKNKIGQKRGRSRIAKLPEKFKKHYIWPRTVEAAKDPTVDDSGKNKMYYLIAINLFPESKILVPSDSESDDDGEKLLTPITDNISDTDEAGSWGNSELLFSPSPIKRKPLRGRRPGGVTKRITSGKRVPDDLPWRSLRRIQPQPQRRTTRALRQTPPEARITDCTTVVDVIDAVVDRYAKKYGMRVQKTDWATPEPSEIDFTSNRKNAAHKHSSTRINIKNIKKESADSSGEEEVSEAFTVRLELD